MEETKTTLQKIVEQKADQIRCAIEDAIDDEAKIDKYFTNCVTIDNVFLQRDSFGRFTAVLHFDSKKIEKLFEPSKVDLEKLVEKKRRELADIENQIKEREKE